MKYFANVSVQTFFIKYSNISPSPGSAGRHEIQWRPCDLLHMEVSVTWRPWNQGWPRCNVQLYDRWKSVSLTVKKKDRDVVEITRATTPSGITVVDKIYYQNAYPVTAVIHGLYSLRPCQPSLVEERRPHLLCPESGWAFQWTHSQKVAENMESTRRVPTACTSVRSCRTSNSQMPILYYPIILR